MSPSLSKAGNIIKYLERNKEGFRMKFTWTGKPLLGLSSIKIEDNSNLR